MRGRVHLPQSARIELAAVHLQTRNESDARMVAHRVAGVGDVAAQTFYLATYMQETSDPERIAQVVMSARPTGN